MNKFFSDQRIVTETEPKFELKTSKPKSSILDPVEYAQNPSKICKILFVILFLIGTFDYSLPHFTALSLYIITHIRKKVA